MTLNMRDIRPDKDAVARAAIDRTCHNGGVKGHIGDLQIGLARSYDEIATAQSVRFDVFANELGASLPPEAMRLRRDIDTHDAVCDHLLVLDRAITGGPEHQIVATCRLLRHDVARANDGFNSRSEFTIDDMLARHPQIRFMETGRFCARPKYRNRHTVELLWQGIEAYMMEHGIDAMFGCASIPGAIPEAHALSLSFLHHNCLATGQWAVSARPELYKPMDLMPREAIDTRAALSGLPPLIKGYLRLGAKVGEGAVVDRAFGTTNLMIVLPGRAISTIHIKHHGADGGRFGS